jgi:hypothetical protein
MRRYKILKGEGCMWKIFTKHDKRTNLDKEIDSVLEKMSNYTPDSDEYTAITENLERLYKAKAGMKVQRNIPWEAITVGAFGLVQILLIMNHEKVDVITTKAMGYVTKGRV